MFRATRSGRSVRRQRPDVALEARLAAERAQQRLPKTDTARCHCRGQTKPISEYYLLPAARALFDGWSGSYRKLVGGQHARRTWQRQSHEAGRSIAARPPTK